MFLFIFPMPTFIRTRKYCLCRKQSKGVPIDTIMGIISEGERPLNTVACHIRFTSRTNTEFKQFHWFTGKVLYYSTWQNEFLSSKANTDFERSSWTCIFWSKCVVSFKGSPFTQQVGYSCIKLSWFHWLVTDISERTVFYHIDTATFFMSKWYLQCAICQRE